MSVTEIEVRQRLSTTIARLSPQLESVREQVECFLEFAERVLYFAEVVCGLSLQAEFIGGLRGAVAQFL